MRKQKSQKLVYNTFIEKDAAWMMSAIIMEENVTQILSIIKLLLRIGECHLSGEIYSSDMS